MSPQFSKAALLQSFVTVESLDKWLKASRLEGKTIGFVPTMGALHTGHVALIKEARKHCNVVVASVFVNPTQFNSIEDLDKYPRTLGQDIRKLMRANCDVVFVPEVKTIYPNFPHQTQFIQMDFGALNQVMEGAYRPGHFEGVVNVVYRLLDIVKPNMAFFGEKDFQQLTIIREMTRQFALNIEIVACPTVRETTGLAMSSRNKRLSLNAKKEALVIYQTLQLAKQLAHTESPDAVVAHCVSHFKKSALELEYITICDPQKLQPLKDQWVPGSRCFIAAYCDGVRLIDNMELIP